MSETARKERRIHHRLIAIAYRDETIAGRAAEEVERCAEDLQIDPDATAVVICDRNGRCHMITGRRPDAMAHWSKFWGALLEALVKGDDSTGLDPEFRIWLENALRPGHSLFFLAVTDAVRERVIDVLSPFGGETASAPLGDDYLRSWVVGGDPDLDG